MLLLEHLLEVFSSPADRFSLYVASVENKFGSVFRQISMHTFEQAFHGARRAQGEQSVEQINALWATSQRALYGNTVDFNSEYEYWWMYIPHFIHTPFYVYAYAFGELLSVALFQQYRRKGDAFVDAYIQMLATGGGAAPEELLKPLGVRLNSRAFWQGGVDYISRQVDETKALYEAL
jgi:oligoendopeptidase F